MVSITNKWECTGCGACANVCPMDCVSMDADKEGFLYPMVDAAACVECGLCEKVCPVNQEKPAASLKKAYAAYHNDAAIRRASSSGGVFTAIAEAVVLQNGVVFGASLDDKFQVIHSYAETAEGLGAFRGSKYVQSEIGEAYKQAKAFLENGRLVLFSGTPCQIGGLLAYLRKPYDNLICQDIICHGVPSPLAWEKYLADQEQRHKSTCVAASFRNKTYGWNRFSMQLQFACGATYTQTLARDSFMKAFLGNYCLRPSCYRCAFKQEERQADITLADFWGIDEVAPEMNDDCGTSLVLVHSHKGQQLWDTVSPLLEYTAVEWRASVRQNSAMYCSVAMPDNRNAFMEALFRKSFIRAVQRYCEPSVLDRLKVRLNATRYFPNRILIKLLGEDRYKRLRSVIKRDS